MVYDIMTLSVAACLAISKCLRSWNSENNKKQDGGQIMGAEGWS